ncbi:methyltransferase domain-containing protein [Rhodopirellula europaea]|jgi:2-polyprenyl-3-methyl-5-hydroxy-6-metoxy-1,4-benzoquinol methylase|uniref:Methyltransferase type 11 n=1 Tax=Rhodopirellula europaea SH398 TaxID=1263868 RepID=M5SBC7_9BACT|nr:methyltransferase domain-containing protein [Rhodopirellula europaea]EMI28953.1 Methyltransferase type 11 [Rhodopirellula europaea SH398]
MTFARIRSDEWMDDPGLDPDRHRQALAGLARLNRISLVSRVFYPRLVRLAQQQPRRPLRILDVASGSADLPIDWLCRAKRQGIRMEVTSLDRSETAMDFASESAKAAGVTLGTVVRDCLADGLPSGFDVVTNSLFMHHLENYQAVRLIQEMWRVSERSVLICDLDRSSVNLALVAAASRLVSRSDVVHHDATASVRAAYSRPEFSSLLRQAMGYDIPVRISFPCRFLAAIDQTCVAERVGAPSPILSGAIP